MGKVPQKPALLADATWERHIGFDFGKQALTSRRKVTNMRDNSSGPLLKIEVTKGDVQAFCDVCVPMRSIWQHFHILFEGTDSQQRLLQSIAPMLFGDINKLLIEHIILQICKITDPEESRGLKNLTIEFLVKNSDFSSAQGDLGKLKTLSTSIHEFRNKIVPARNKLIGHLDREAVLKGEPLGATRL